MDKNVGLDLTKFIPDDNVMLDTEEQELLAGIKDSKSIISDSLVKRYSDIAKAQNKCNKQNQYD